MPPKRKATNSGGGSSKPAKKQKASKDAQPPHADDEPRNASPDAPGRTEVRWGLPATARDNNAPDTSNEITRFAPALYNQDWDELTTHETAFGFPRLRTPLYKTRTDKEYVPPGNNISQTSQAVLDFFHVIKGESAPQKKGTTLGPYARSAFENAFGDEDDDFAVVASRSGDHPVRALDQDYRLAVTVRDGDREASAHVDLIRRATPTPAATGHAYFIDLPAGTNVTINGHTYVNDREAAGETATTSPFIIGPFTGYTVIELLSQPVFFFRGREDLNLLGPVVSGARARPSPEELENRDQNGDVPVENTTVTWTAVSTAAPASPTSTRGSKTSKGRSTRNRSTRSGSTRSGSTPAPQIVSVNPRVTHTSSRNAPQASPKGPTTVEDESAGSDTISTPPSSGANSPVPERATYDDTWTDQGEPITNPCDYLSRHLLSPHEHRYPELIPRVLASINDRQFSGAGFSFQHNNRILRPGRTLIAPLNQNGHHVLLVLQLQPEFAGITVRILDPMAWKSTLAERDKFVELALALLEDGEWWQETYESLTELNHDLPDAFEWVPCAQHTASEQSVVFTVLHAWAVALGLELDPAFRLGRDESVSFFTRAQRLFDLALRDHLDWKILLAFFRCTGFVETGDEEAENSDESLPPHDRRFDQRVRGFQSSLERQENPDVTLGDASFGADFSFVISTVEVVLEQGVAHTKTFASDDWDEAKLEDLASLVQDGSWSLADTQEQLIERVSQRENGDESVSTPTSSKKSSGTFSSLTKSSSRREDKTSGSKPPPGPVSATVPDLDQDPAEDDSNASANGEDTASSSTSPPPDHDLPKDYDPCVDFRQRMDGLLREHDADLRDLRDRERNTVTTEYGEWLDDTEVSLAIASVTLAISELQGIDGGFGFFHPISIQQCAADTYPLPISPTLRPGRPLLLPIHIQAHYILLVIQLDEQGQTSFSVLDSKAYHLNMRHRQSVHDLAQRIVKRSDWNRHVTGGEDLIHHSPPHTTWIPVSQQPSDNECGYYTILNAWTLALGLLPNPNIHHDWNDQFFSDVNNLVHLARLGRADWKLIYSFLRCRGFANDGHVPRDRQFTATRELRNEGEYLETALDDMHALEEVHFMGHPALDRQQLKDINRMALPVGRRHNDNATFRSDQWSNDDRVNYASDLARYGKLDLNFTRANLRSAHTIVRDIRGLHLRKELGDNIPNYQQLPRAQLLDATRRYLAGWHTGRDLFLREDGAKGTANLCQFFEDTKQFLKYIFFSPNCVGEKLKGGLFERHTVLMRDGGLEKAKNGKYTRAGDLMLDDSDMNMAIAAVVDAIDTMQSPTDSESIFAGGFSLATSVQLQMGLAAISGDNLLPALDAWRKKNRVPTKSQGQAGGHHLLAVVQEQRKKNPHFEVTLYDSATHVFGNAYPFLNTAVVRAATALKWSTHRNPDYRVKFATTPRTAAVAQQPTGGWQCGPHVVINAWILAMGLHPAPNAKFTDEVYSEFYTLARAACAGLLDWRTLATWFFCRKLTLQTGLEAVPQNRRFTITQFWENEEELTIMWGVLPPGAEVTDNGKAKGKADEEEKEVYPSEDESDDDVVEAGGDSGSSADAQGDTDEEGEALTRAESDQELMVSGGEDEEAASTDSSSLPTLPSSPEALTRAYEEEPMPSFLGRRRSHHIETPPKHVKRDDNMYFLDAFDDMDDEMRDVVVPVEQQWTRRSSEYRTDRLFFLDAY
ncbi:hypothetical protein N0V83_006368 [Neocucurbitaria cava]|uniref:Ubiquitin-like protease family profile domain-containing protein n=1 Tax=Neocucurbitaria cava TaxID=798079 RepID=A0A9W9CL58_9PLEO|nr:hypothetical protein N0V83_006368 [Neocucurbitaria cava]